MVNLVIQLYFTTLWKSFLGQNLKNWNMENCWYWNFSYLQAYTSIFKLSFKTRRQKNVIAQKRESEVCLYQDNFKNQDFTYTSIIHNKFIR